jgi:uncharacterized protein
MNQLNLGLPGRPFKAAPGSSADSAPHAPSGKRPLRGLWLAGGFACLALGTVGMVVPLLPTVDFYIMAAWCFSRSSRRWEAWLLNHPRIGPLVRDWRANRSVPMGAKCLATLSMTASCAWAAHALPLRTAWIPAAVCLPVACYLWTRPTRRAAAARATASTSLSAHKATSP